LLSEQKNSGEKKAARKAGKAARTDEHWKRYEKLDNIETGKEQRREQAANSAGATVAGEFDGTNEALDVG
jgi:hypothetical protein